MPARPSPSGTAKTTPFFRCVLTMDHSWRTTGSLAVEHSDAREAEDALGDDVALDLAGAAGNGAAERAHPLQRPRAFAPHRRAEASRVEAADAVGLEADLHRPLHRLAPEQLEHRVLG